MFFGIPAFGKVADIGQIAAGKGLRDAGVFRVGGQAFFFRAVKAEVCITFIFAGVALFGAAHCAALNFLRDFSFYAGRTFLAHQILSVGATRRFAFDITFTFQITGVAYVVVFALIFFIKLAEGGVADVGDMAFNARYFNFFAEF